MDIQPVMDDTLKNTIGNVMKELLDNLSTEKITFCGDKTETRVDYDEYEVFQENVYNGTIKENIVETICENTGKFIDYVKKNIQKVQNWNQINKYSEQLPDNRQISREWYYDEDFYNDWNKNTPEEYKQAFILSLIIPELTIENFQIERYYDSKEAIKEIILPSLPPEQTYTRFCIVNKILNIQKILQENGDLSWELGSTDTSMFSNEKLNIYEILNSYLVVYLGMKLSAINLYLLYGFYKYIISTPGGGGNQGGGGGNQGGDGKETSNVIIRF